MGANPESRTSGISCFSGFRARRFAASRNDRGGFFSSLTRACLQLVREGGLFSPVEGNGISQISFRAVTYWAVGLRRADRCDAMHYATTSGAGSRIFFVWPREGHVGGTAADNRLFIEGNPWYRYRAGIPWRDLPERFWCHWEDCLSALQSVGEERVFRAHFKLLGERP